MAVIYAADMKDTWDNVTVPESLFNFFASLFNYNMGDFNNTCDSSQIEQMDGDDDPVESGKVSNSRRFQIMYLRLHNDNKRIPLPMVKSKAIYDNMPAVLPLLQNSIAFGCAAVIIN